jgi:hypothetical protein
MIASMNLVARRSELWIRVLLEVVAAAVTMAAVLVLVPSRADAYGDGPETRACNQVIDGLPGAVMQNVAVRTDGPGDLATLDLTLTRTAGEPAEDLLVCVWIDSTPNGRLDLDERLTRKLFDIDFVVIDGVEVAHVTKPDLGTDGDNTSPICTAAATIVPDGGEARVVQASTISCASSLVPVVSESSDAAALTGAGLAAVLGVAGIGWVVRRRTAVRSTR